MTEKKEVRMYGVMSTHIDVIWEDVFEYLEKAILHSDGKYKIEDIYTSLKERDMQLWVAFDNDGVCAICVTQLIKYPQKKVMYMLFIAGREAINWLHLTDDLAQFARDHGCESIEGYGRPGWEKILPEGFKKIHTIYRMDLQCQQLH